MDTRAVGRGRCATLMTVMAALLTGACGGERREAHVVRDSAGIRLVENAAYDSAGDVSLREDLRFGDAAGEPVFQFGSIADLAVDPGGRILVLDGLAGEVRVFGEDGAYVRTLGRRGAGPGELSRWVTAVITDAAGNVYVPDPVQRRMTVFDSSGATLPALPIPSQPAGQSWLRSADGTFLLRGMSVSRGPDGAFRFWDGLLRTRASADSSGAVLDTLFVFEFPQTAIGAPPDVRVPLIVNTPFWAALPDGRIAWSSLDRSDVLVHDAAGRRTAVIRSRDWRRGPVSRGDVAILRERLRERLESLGGDASAADGPNVAAPDSLPAITALLVDGAGRLWVQRMGSASEVDASAVNSAAARTAWLGGRVWDVLDQDGVIRSRAVLPAGVRPLRITRDRLYGVMTDSVGVQRVVRYTLQ